MRSNDAFEGKVIDASAGMPASPVLIVGQISTELVAWDNSGRGGGPHVISEEYAISDSQGRFSFPSMSAVAGPAFYSFGLVRTISGPYFTPLSFGDNHPLYALENVNSTPLPMGRTESIVGFQAYLEGEKRLDFRREDYPTLLLFLEEWHRTATERLLRSEKIEELYQKYKALFSSG